MNTINTLLNNPLGELTGAQAPKAAGANFAITLAVARAPGALMNLIGVQHPSASEPGLSLLGAETDSEAKAGHLNLRWLLENQDNLVAQGLKRVDAQELLQQVTGSSAEASTRDARLSGVDIKPLDQLAAGATNHWRHLGKAIQPVCTTAPLLPPTHDWCVSHTPIKVMVEPQATSASLEQAFEAAASQASEHLDGVTYLETLFKR